jgi:hypothetical protein
VGAGSSHDARIRSIDRADVHENTEVSARIAAQVNGWHLNIAIYLRPTTR